MPGVGGCGGCAAAAFVSSAVAHNAAIGMRVLVMMFLLLAAQKSMRHTSNTVQREKPVAARAKQSPSA